MNMLVMVTSQYQPTLSSITNFSPGGSANQIAVFTSNYSFKECPEEILIFDICSEDFKV